MKHNIFTGRFWRGNQLYNFGKCLCGAELQSMEEIDEHRRLSEEDNGDPAEDSSD